MGTDHLWELTEPADRTPWPIIPRESQQKVKSVDQMPPNQIKTYLVHDEGWSNKLMEPYTKIKEK